MTSRAMGAQKDNPVGRESHEETVRTGKESQCEPESVKQMLEMSSFTQNKMKLREKSHSSLLTVEE